MLVDGAPERRQQGGRGAPKHRGSGEGGDEEAFAALVREVGDRCIFIAHRILRDASLAEDAVQVALVRCS
jgi:DNA-directed RNA polymerase specialized sigma24 family protein